MENRLLLAYGLILLLAIGGGLLWRHLTRERRGERRAYRRSELLRRHKRKERVRAERGA